MVTISTSSSFFPLLRFARFIKKVLAPMVVDADMTMLKPLVRPLFHRHRIPPLGPHTRMGLLWVKSQLPHRITFQALLHPADLLPPLWNQCGPKEPMVFQVMRIYPILWLLIQRKSPYAHLQLLVIVPTVTSVPTFMGICVTSVEEIACIHIARMKERNTWECASKIANTLKHWGAARR